MLLVNTLVWVATKLSDLSYRILWTASELEDRYREPLEEQEPTTVEELIQPKHSVIQDVHTTPSEDMCAYAGETDVMEDAEWEDATGPEDESTTGEDTSLSDAAATTTLEPLPAFEVFSAMFERRYGKTGKMPISIQGDERQYDVKALYLLLEKISTHENPNALMHAIYGSVLSLVMHAHGEKPLDVKYLN